ncbi:MAG: hypothetical protein IJT44_13350 [Clostridia bacterium]|nr:hypothetical protein [Clostridia bacterium]
MKKTTAFKIAFCVLLAAALLYGAVGFRFVGRNRLHAAFAEVHNADFEAQADPGGREYYTLRLKVTAVNDNDFDVTVRGLRVEKGDESGFTLECTPERDVTIPAHTAEPQNIWFRIVSYGPENEEILEMLRKDFAVRIVYTADGENERTEWIK